jgi:hypothetical protein
MAEPDESAAPELTAVLRGWAPKRLDLSADEENRLRVYGFELHAEHDALLEELEIEPVLCYRRGATSTKRARRKRRVVRVLDASDLPPVAALLPWQAVRLADAPNTVRWPDVEALLRSPVVRQALSEGLWAPRRKLRKRSEETDRVQARERSARRNCDGFKRSAEARKLREPWRLTPEARALTKKRAELLAVERERAETLAAVRDEPLVWPPARTQPQTQQPPLKRARSEEEAEAEAEAAEAVEEAAEARGSALW